MDNLFDAFCDFFNINTNKFDYMQHYPDIIENICMFLPYKNISTFASCSTFMYKYTKNNNILNKRRYFGFPRKNESCFVHDVVRHSNIMSNKPRYVMFIRHDPPPIKERLNQLLQVLIDENIDLVRGDLLYIKINYSINRVPYSENHYYTFDGIDIIDIRYLNNLPKEYIVNDIPIHYWHNVTDNSILLNIIDHREQLINDIKHDGLFDNAQYTQIMLNNKHYYIIFTDIIEVGKPIIEKIKIFLSNMDQLILLHEGNILQCSYTDNYMYDQNTFYPVYSVQ